MKMIQTSITAAVIWFSLTPAHAAQSPEPIEKAIGVALSPSGQKYFDENLGAILSRNGISLEGGYYEELGFQIPDSVTDRLEDLRKRINKITLGLDLNQSNPEMTIKNFSYLSNSKLNIRADWESMERNPTPGKISFLASMQINDIHLAAESISVQDRANSILGTWGLNEFHFATHPSSPDLRIQVPLEIKIQPDQSIEFSAKQLSSNIADIQFALPNRIDIQAPKLGIRIGQQKGIIDFAEIGQFIDIHKDSILLSVQKSLNTFIKEKLPTEMNREIKQGYNPNDPEVDLMDPPGAPSGKKVEKFQFGIQLSEFKTTPERLIIGHLDTFIEDPTLKSLKVQNERPIDQEPKFTHESLKSDLTFAVRESLINRALYLSFLRGYFDRVDIGGGEFIQLVSAPTIQLDQINQTDLIPLSVDAHYRTEDFLARTLAIKNPLHMKFQLNVQIKKTESGIKLIQHSINLNSLKLDPASLRKLGLKKTVLKTVQKMMKKTNDDWAKTESLLSDEVLIPKSFYGVGLKLNHFRANDGYMYLYFNLGEI